MIGCAYGSPYLAPMKPVLHRKTKTPGIDRIQTPSAPADGPAETLSSIAFLDANLLF